MMWLNVGLSFCVAVLLQCCQSGDATGETNEILRSSRVSTTAGCQYTKYESMYFYGSIIKVQPNVASADKCVALCWKFVIAGARRCQAVNYVADEKRCEFMHQKFDVSNRLLVKYYGDRNPNAAYCVPINCPANDQAATTKAPSGGDDSSGGQGTCGTTTLDPMGGGVTGRNSFMRIVGGTQAKPNSIPWIVSIRLGFTERNHACGGTLVSVGDATESDIIITAAHCVFNEFEPDNVEIVAGAHNANQENPGEQKVEYEEYAMHDKYDHPTKANDIAVVKLKTPLKFGPSVQPACLPTNGEQLEDGKKGLVAGWGRLKEGEKEKHSETLQQLAVPVVNSQSCSKLYEDVEKPKFTDEKIMFCAGYPEGGKDSCQGDSGGPLFFKDPKGNYVLQGVVSFGTGCAREGKAGVYTRVSTYVDWIKENIKKMSTVGKQAAQRRG